MFQEWGREVHTPHPPKRVSEAKRRRDTVSRGIGFHVVLAPVGCPLGPYWKGEKMEMNAL